MGLSIGWDVGGWNCDKNPRSRDALVVLDSERRMVGKPWRGNLRARINEAGDTGAFRSMLLNLCGVKAVAPDMPITLAIDAPLGLPLALIELLTQGRSAGVLGSSAENPYLFRYTERHLFAAGLSPLSAIKDMIGSQSTKAIHAVSRFSPIVVATGVWSDGCALRVIETYPAACRGRLELYECGEPTETAAASDIEDARVCALIAHRFAGAPETLEAPPLETPASEGWIWLPIQH